MDNRLENLEKTVELLQRDMADREARINQQMGEREDRISQQMADIKEMLRSIMTKQNNEKEESRCEDVSFKDSGVQSDLQNGKVGREEEEEVADDDKKYWIRRKVELPNFDGNDPSGWLIRAEKFFAIHEVKPDAKVEMACVSMDGPAVHWFQCLKLRWPNLSWEKFRVELMKRYCGRHSGNVYE